jgi:secreted PhoX family phosphatase
VVPNSVRVWGGADPGSRDGGPLAANFDNPANVAVTSDGSVFVADYDSSLVRKIDKSGNVSTVVSQENFVAPFGLTVTKTGQLYVQTDGDPNGNKNDTTGTVWSVDSTTGVATPVVSDIGRPRGLLALPSGKIAMSDLVQDTIEILDPTNATVTTIAGTAGQAGFMNATGAAARFARPYGMALAPDGSILVADQTNNCIRKVTLDGVVTTFAGTGAAGATNGAALTATFTGPEGVAVYGANVYVADTEGFLVRRINNGQVYTEAGNGTQGFVDALGTAAEFYGLEGISITPDGKELWIADGNQGDGTNHNRVRRLQVP